MFLVNVLCINDFKRKWIMYVKKFFFGVCCSLWFKCKLLKVIKVILIGFGI